MPVRIERHIFGSFDGYKTLARSPGVSAEDCRLLERTSFAFGQCHDPRFAPSLAKAPAYFTRVLPGARRGLTRVLEGQPDDHDRPTLCLVTAILAQRDWDGLLGGDVALLLAQPALWAWDQAAPASLAALDPALPPPAGTLPARSVPRLLALVSEVERALAQRRGVIVSAEEYTLAEVAALEMLVPPPVRRQFTSAYRSLSAQLPVTLSALAAEAGGAGRPTFRPPDALGELSPYAAFLQGTTLAAGAIPFPQIAAYGAFGEAPRAAGGAAVPVPTGPTVPASRRAPLWPLVLVALLGLLLAGGAFVAGLAVGYGLRSKPPTPPAPARPSATPATSPSTPSTEDPAAPPSVAATTPAATAPSVAIAPDPPGAATPRAATQPAPPPVANLPLDAKLARQIEENKALRVQVDALKQHRRAQFEQFDSELARMLRGLAGRDELLSAKTVAQIKEHTARAQGFEEWALTDSQQARRRAALALEPFVQTLGAFDQQLSPWDKVQLAGLDTHEPARQKQVADLRAFLARFDDFLADLRNRQDALPSSLQTAVARTIEFYQSKHKSLTDLAEQQPSPKAPERNPKPGKTAGRGK